MKMEEWKPIKGYERYLISNSGKVKNANTGRILKPMINNNGYLRIGLYKNEKRKLFKIHRLIAQAFIPNPDNKPQINHIDGNKQNNHISNLEWCTSKENIQHAFKLGLYPSRKGKKSNASKLTDNDVIKIKQLIKEGLTQTAISKMFDVTISTISYIKNNKTWSHIKLLEKKMKNNLDN